MSNIYDNMIDLLFSKYRNSPNILGTIEILSSPLQDTEDAITYVLDHLSIDDAEGEILDFLGELIGVKRPEAQEDDLFILCRDEDVAGDTFNNYGLSTDSLTEGGYLTGDDGCPSKSNPESFVDNETMRQYIRAKASSFRQKATRDILYSYILQFGVRSKLIESDKVLEIEPSAYHDLDYSLRYHLENLGFRPAGIQVKIKQQTLPDSEV